MRGGKFMKKVLASFLLLFISAVIVFVSIVVNIFFCYSVPGVLLILSTMSGISFGISCLYKIFERKFSMSRTWFWFSTYLPALVCCVLDLAIAYFNALVLHQFYMGPGALLVFYSVPITSAVYGLFGTGWLIVTKLIAKKKAEKI